MVCHIYLVLDVSLNNTYKNSDKLVCEKNSYYIASSLLNVSIPSELPYICILYIPLNSLAVSKVLRPYPINLTDGCHMRHSVGVSLASFDCISLCEHRKQSHTCFAVCYAYNVSLFNIITISFFWQYNSISSTPHVANFICSSTPPGKLNVAPVPSFTQLRARSALVRVCPPIMCYLICRQNNTCCLAYHGIWFGRHLDKYI